MTTLTDADVEIPAAEARIVRSFLEGILPYLRKTVSLDLMGISLKLRQFDCM